MNEKEMDRIADVEVEELYDRYLDKAREEVTEEDLPEDPDYNFYRWLGFEYQHLLGQCNTKTWSHANKMSTNKLIFLTEKLKIGALAMMLIAIIAGITAAIIGEDFYITLTVILFAAMLVLFFVSEWALTFLLERRSDILRMAARYQVMHDILETRFLEEDVTD